MEIKNNLLSALYGIDDAEKKLTRIENTVAEFKKLYGNRDFSLFSVAGRTEICGNHTDHNRGCVVAASVGLDIIAVASPTDDGIIRIKSEGFSEDVVSLGDLLPVPSEMFHSSALIRGVCEKFRINGRNIGGFVAYTTSDILKGSGLSSSAAFEDLVGTILNHFYNDGCIGFEEIAIVSQYAENVHFGKPSGLMDQMACAAGGLVYIDFENPVAPKTERIVFNPEQLGYSLFIVNTGGSHASLNDDYAAIPAEMKKVASFFGADALRGISKVQIIENTGKLRSYAGDRAIIRALHFCDENERVQAVKESAKISDINGFLDAVNRSGYSSFTLLQNYYSPKCVSEQGLSLAYAVARETIGSDGAVRVHGGGFAGTVQAFVPHSKSAVFRETLDSVFGTGSAIRLNIRPFGALKIDYI